MDAALADRIVAQSCEALSLDQLAHDAIGLIAERMNLTFAACYEESATGVVVGSSPEAVPAILAEYGPYVPTCPLHALKQRGVPPVAVMTRLVDRTSLVRSAVHNEFYRPMGLIHHVIMRLDRRDTSVTGVVMCRDNRRGDFEPGELRLLARVLPALSATVRRLHRFEAAVSRVSMLERLLDSADQSARCVIDARGRVLWASSPMKTIAAGLTREHPLVRAAIALCRDGAPGVLHELAGAHELFDAELTVVRDGTNPPVVEARLRDDPARRFARWAESKGLTPGEIAVLRELCRGASNDEIADAMFLSANTVRTHLNRIFKKVGTTSRLETVVAARAAGLA
jgi:DNA-binding CsgD family transcriptional regulator